MKTNSLDFDAQALRDKILDLAIRGKLVSQDPDDEPASVLLEKIKAEKAELIKEKKIKKSKPLPPITDDEKPFDIPDSWEWVRLGDVITLISGRDIPKKYHLLTKNINSTPYITGASNIKDNGKINISEWIDNPSVVVKKGTLLLSVKGTIGKIARLEIPKAHIARQIMGIENTYKLNSNFQEYFLESYIQELKKKAKSMIPGISRDDLLFASVPLPPLSEQSRIAAKIAQLFALLRKVESSTQQYAKLQTLLKSKVLDLAMRGKLVKQDPNDEPASVLLEKIKANKQELIKEKKIKKSKPLPPITDDEKPFDIPDSWEWVRLGDVSLITTGNTPSKNNLAFYGGNISFIKPADIQNTAINYNTDEFLSKEGEKKGRIAHKGDILITCIGNLGRNNVLNKKVAYNQQINSISPVIVNSEVLHFFMLSNFFISSMYRLASATTLPILNKSKLENMFVSLPPLNEQQRIIKQILKILRGISND